MAEMEVSEFRSLRRMVARRRLFQARFCPARFTHIPLQCCGTSRWLDWEDGRGDVGPRRAQDAIARRETLRKLRLMCWKDSEMPVLDDSRFHMPRDSPS